MSRNKANWAASGRRRHRLLQLERLEERIVLSAGFRTIDGWGNNLDNPDSGTANTPLVRLTTVEYGGDGTGSDLARRVDSSGNTINPRTVSNLVFDQPPVDVTNDRGLSSFVFQWGQFLDHDMDLTEDTPPVGVANEDLGLLPNENISYMVPVDGTEQELPPGTIIPMLRSRFVLDENGIRQQINQITSFIDASNVYASDSEKAAGLRAHYGGFMLSSNGSVNLADGTGDFLPFNTLGLENAAPPTTGTGVPIEAEELFVAGDVRSNEQPGLTAFHTLFVREHNYQARRIAMELNYGDEDLADPEIDEQIYQLARQIVGSEVQAITYNEFLPALLGPVQLSSYQGYDASVDAGIANIFAHAMYRVGHTMLPNELMLLNADGSPVADDPDVLGASVVDGKVALGEAFFNPELITRFGIEPYLKGLSEQQIQEIDNMIVDGVRNLLFDPPAAVDLGATNLQRGRDHGLPDYNQARIDFGLSPVTDFADVSQNSGVAAALAAAYDGDVNNMDAWAAAISEDHLPGGSVGELMHTVLVDQFTRLRDGDRFYYEQVFSGKRLAEIQNTLLSDIIRRNTALQFDQNELFRSEDVFVYRSEFGCGNMNVTLRVRDDELQVVKGGGNCVIASKAIRDTDIVVIFGTSKDDTLRIDASVAELYHGSVEVHGGDGKDTLVVDGNCDQIVDEPPCIYVNGLEIVYGNFERVKVRACAEPPHSIASHNHALAWVPIVATSNNDMAAGDLRADRLTNHGRSRVSHGTPGAPHLGDVAQDTSVANTSTREVAGVTRGTINAASTADNWYRDRWHGILDNLLSESVAIDSRAVDHFLNAVSGDCHQLELILDSFLD